MLIRIHRVAGAHYFEDEAVAFEPDWEPGPTELPDVTFVIEVPDPHPARVSDNDRIEFFMYRLVDGGVGGGMVRTITATAADLVACAKAATHGLRMVESIVLHGVKKTNHGDTEGTETSPQ